MRARLRCDVGGRLAVEVSLRAGHLEGVRWDCLQLRGVDASLPVGWRCCRRHSDMARCAATAVAGVEPGPSRWPRFGRSRARAGISASGSQAPRGRRRCPVPHRRVVVAGGGPRPQTSRRVAGHGHRHWIAIWLPRRCATPRQSAQPAVPPIAERRDGARCDTSGEADKNAAGRASRPLERDPLDEPSADGRESTRKWFWTDSRRAAAEALQAGVASSAGEPLKHFSIESDRCLRSVRRHGRKYAASEFTIEFQAPKSLFRASFGHLEPDRGVYGQVSAERGGENGAKCRDRLLESICRLGDRRRPRPVK